ncbi:MAG: radical SAM protein [Deltaproteobacteria bacterium]|nr:radical SAM protein [Deltaproteobacteria bacterium]
MKVLLIATNTLKEPYPVYPLGLDYVAGAIEGHAVRIVDMNGMDGLAGVVSAIEAFSPDVIGLSLRNIDNTDTTDPRGFIGQYRDLVAAIRRHSRARLILGGSGFTIFPAETMQALGADFGVVGEGERLGPLLSAIEAGRDARGLSGVITVDSQAVVPEPWEGDISRRLDTHPDCLSFYLENGGMLNLQTKRGCHFKCIYCTYPRIEGRRLRLTNPDEAARAARRLQEQGARYFFVTDSVFNSDIDHSLAVARAFKKHGVSIPWGAFFTPLEQPDGYFDRMAEAGLTHVEFGTDSLSNSVLASYRKPFRDRRVFKVHREAIDAGLYVAHYFLLGGVGETRRTLAETLEKVDTLEKAALFFFCGMRIYPGTELYRIALAEGQVEEGRSILEPVFYRPPTVGTGEIVERLQARAGGRINWVTGSGGEETAEVIRSLYKRGHTGPMWEYLIKLS